MAPTDWIVDTNVISRHGGTVSGTIAGQWLVERSGSFWISVATVAEMRRGLMLAEEKLTATHDQRVIRRDRPKFEAGLAWYTTLVGRFSSRLLPIDVDIAARWAETSTKFPSLRDGDKIILATALAYGCGIATRNVKDFQNGHVSLTNPFDPEAWWPAPFGWSGLFVGGLSA